MIVREGKPFRQAFAELGVVESEIEMIRIFNSKPFQEVLWSERHRYHAEIANNPSRSKTAAIGLAVIACQRLAEKGEWEKVLEGVLKLAKMEGWVGGDSQTFVIGNVTAKDIEQAKAKLLKEFNDRGSQLPPSAPPDPQPN
jgi:hypothetical protein